MNDTETLATCQHCGHEVEFVRSSRGFSEFVHVATGTADDCPE